MLWSDEQINRVASAIGSTKARQLTTSFMTSVRNDLRDEYEARITELEADHAAALDKWMDAIADLQASLRKTRERIIELEAQLAAIAATDNGTLPEDPRLNMWRDDAIAILESHGWQTPQRLTNGEIEYIMHTDARGLVSSDGAPVKYRWLDDWCMWVDAKGDPVLAKDKGTK